MGLTLGGFGVSCADAVDALPQIAIAIFLDATEPSLEPWAVPRGAESSS